MLINHIRRPLVTFVLLFLFVAPSLLAHPAPRLACEPAARTLAEVKSSEALFFGTAPNSWSQYILCTDGRYTAARESSSLDQDSALVISHGQLSPEELLEVNLAMLDARIGFAEDCELDLGPDPPPDHLYEEQHRVTWFGRGTRNRTFKASWPAPFDPDCSAELQAVIELLQVRAGADGVAIDGLP